jgi:NAD-dependent SIR2 family protein deacetylase
MSDTENVFLRLVYALKELKSCKNSTIILGAGCSLNSTSRDITTAGIMRQCLIEHKIKDDVNLYSWETLYQKFINVVWEGKAKAERELLLSKKLEGIVPSEGHRYLRTLVENEYVNTIITTNFDMLIEDAFEGLS